MGRRNSFSGTEQRASGLLWPTVAMLMALALLVSLGTWQLSRKAWKDDLIETIKLRAAGDPIVFDAAVTLFRAGEDLEYTPVRVRGRFIPAKAMLYYAPDSKLGPGYHVYMPLETQVGELVIVNRGFVPEREAGAVRSRMQGPLEPASEVIGLLRRPAMKALFTPSNEPGRNLWYWRDIEAMSANAKSEANKTVVPFFLDALPNAGPISAGMGRGGATRLELPNRHLEYALTWYGLAASLIGVYLVFVRSRRLSNRKLSEPLLPAKRRNWGNS